MTSYDPFDRRDLDFLLHEVEGIAALCRHPRFADHSRETFDATLTFGFKNLLDGTREYEYRGGGVNGSVGEFDGHVWNPRLARWVRNSCAAARCVSSCCSVMWRCRTMAW